MILKINLLSGLCLLMFSVSTFGLTQTLGSAETTSKLKSFGVSVRNCGNNLTHVKLRVRGANMYIDSIGAMMVDGSTKAYPLRRILKAGFESKWIEVNTFRPSRGCVKYLYLQARSVNPRRPARFQVLGSLH